MYEGRPVIKVPVIMARSDVVMNGSLLPQEELLPETWDGVPVTWGHPSNDQGFLSAQTPDTLSEWGIGRIFNARVEGPALKAEAWIEVDRARNVAPGFVESLLSAKGEMPINVSTGYFSKDVKAQGELNGRTYEMINRDVKPNHLAILVGEDGACSWEDGCGLRGNKRSTQVIKLNRKDQAAFDTLKAAIRGGKVDKTKIMLDLFVNERGQDDDRRQIMADLISRNESPYTPDDEQALMMMSDATLRRMRDDYIARAEDPDAGKEPDPEDPAEGSEDEGKDNEADGGDAAKDGEDDKKMKDNAAGLPKNMAELTGVITKVVAASLKGHQAKPVTVNAKDLAKELAPLIITDEMKRAMAFVGNQVKSHRDSLISKIVANTAITKEAAEKMDDATLEVVANGILPTPNFSGRATFTEGVEVDEEDPAIAAMTSHENLRQELIVHSGGKNKAA